MDKMEELDLKADKTEVKNAKADETEHDAPVISDGADAEDSSSSV